MSNSLRHVHVLANDDVSLSNQTGITVIVYDYDNDGSGMGERYKNFVLPGEENMMRNYIDDIYTSGNSPSNITHADFKKIIIDYVVPISTLGVDYDKLNDYFDKWTNTAESQEQINELLGKAFAKSQEENDLNQKKKEENLTIFESSTAPIDSPTQEKLYELRGDLDFLDDAIETTPEEEMTKKQKDLFGDKPSEGNQRPVIDRLGMSVDKTKVFANLPDSSTMKFKGLGGARLIEPVFEPIYYPGDAFLKSENNSGIICSRDELYRLRGHGKSGAVYIYAGRNGSLKGENSSFENFENEDLETKPQPNNLISDSAYIYISQKADVDSLYKYKVARGTYSKVISPLLPKGERETRKGISLASIKADDVVIMSRTSGIRLITGTDKKNSKGGDQDSKFGIDLIGGNDDSDLQPLVKGDNLVKYLTKLSKTVEQLRSVLYDFMNSQSKFNTKTATHTHIDPFIVLLGTLGPKNPFGIDVASMFGAINGGGKCPPSQEMQSAGTVALLETMRQQANTVNLILNQVGNDTNAFNAIGSYNILSDKNRTN